MVRPEHQDTNINSKYHKVMAWLSPSFPVGAFAYSHGLEFEISVGNISRSDDLYNWLSDILQYGSVWNDLILFCEAYKAKENALNHLSETAMAFAQSKERYNETIEMGKAFSKIISSINRFDFQPMPLPIIVGYISKLERISLNIFFHFMRIVLCQISLMLPLDLFHLAKQRHKNYYLICFL